MSRKLRMEEERAKFQNLDLQEERDKMKLRKERINAPIVWERLPYNVRIEDLKPARYEEALNLIRNYYYTRELLCRNAEMYEEEVSMNSLDKHYIFYCKDCASVIAVDELRKDKVIGVLVTSVVRQAEYTRVFSRQLPVEGEAAQKVQSALNHLMRKVDIFEAMDCDTFLRFQLVCVHPGFSGRGLGFDLMKVGVRVAQNLKMPCIVFFASCNKLQKLAKKIGLQIIEELNYKDYKDKGNKMIFPDPGAGNYSVAIMAGKVAQADPFAAPSLDSLHLPPKKPVEPEVVETVRLTRIEKRALKSKH